MEVIFIDGSILKDIGSYKNTLMTTFQNSDDICELLFNKQPYTPSDVKNLPYTQIFPYLYVDETQTVEKSYICVEVDMPRIPTNTIKDMKVFVWVYCHKGIMKYSKKGYIGTRTDILTDMIERQLRESDKFGIGKLQLQSVEHFFPNKEYYGRQLIYHIPDFKIGR